MEGTSTLRVPVSFIVPLALRNVVAQPTSETCNTDGVDGETSDSPRSLKEGETAEWVLLDGVIGHSLRVVLYVYYANMHFIVIFPDTGYLREYCITQPISRRN